ncbi:hypothetical protein K2X89_00575 [Myxococcota bacterium]|nr:hypothetical protein [Myxococcota bacterium]
MPDTKADPKSDTKADAMGFERRRWVNAIVREVKSHPFGYGVLAAFIVIGPALVMMIFPEAPPSVIVVGGLAFGVYAALCAVPQKFM